MPRKLLQRSDVLPYHVTARANNREEFPLPRNLLWLVIGEECLYLHIVYGVEIQAFVLMPNHFHMILTVPEHDLGIVMNQLMKSISRRVNSLSGRVGHVFGGPYYGSLINSSRYFGHALKYVFRNPVKAGLCEKVEMFPCSTLHGLLGLAPLPFPLFQTRAGMEFGLPSIDTGDQLKWLNCPFPAEAEALIKKGLNRRIFDVMIDRRTRRPVELLTGLI